MYKRYRPPKVTAALAKKITAHVMEGELREAIELLKTVDPGAHKLTIRPKDKSNA